MAERDRPSPSTSRESSGGAMTSSSQQVREEQEENLGPENDHVGVRVDRGIDDHISRYAQPEIVEQQNVGISFRGNFVSFEDVSAIRDDTWSCIIVVLTFWFFVSMTLILGVFGSTKITLGPNASILIEPNPLFVQTVKVEELNEIDPGPMLYAFYKSPPLDVATTWSESYNVSVPSDSHKDFIHFLNKGSQINISYSVKSPGSSVFLIIAQGNDGLAQWLQNPTYPNTTLSWNVVHGSGAIHQDIFTSSNYYVAVGNLNSEAVEVQLDLRLKAIQYNTSEAYYKCTFTQGFCSVNIFFPKGNAIVLASPSTPVQGADSDGWYVKVSYGPRWLTYCVGIGGMTLLMLVAFHFLNKFRCINEDDTGGSYGGMESARDPLLPYKDDDISSWGSSYDSASNDEEDIQEFLATYSIEGKSVKEVEQEGNNTRRLCAICFDAPRDCFFLPCGHCVACFDCGTRIAEAAGTCPICRRNMKKVRKIFTV